ncbi:LOW QUALITY PROTEIN: putative ribosomal RNA-processing protein 7 homolog B [Panulirus ornatus]|uniref:LOW QUALITY PROTEIN: putative ribosomal RNA-processing protein 7 homolog B n=1 Tax=Panulirus ornatus TaxID=150431 RepID=UPI003A8A79E7
MRDEGGFGCTRCYVQIEDESCAHDGGCAVFTHSSAIKKVMSASPSAVLVLSTKEHSVLTGMQKWQQEYDKEFASRTAVSGEIKSLMSEYDKEREEEGAAAQQEPDDEGWVTVTSGKMNKPHLEKIDESENKKKRSKKEKEVEPALVNFYTFQRRQTKIDHLAQLRKKFEEDKKRISMMRASRKFRPY